MAVAEAGKMEDERGKGPEWLSNAMGWGPRKLAELKTFFSEVRAELKKVTWPARNEVYNTTIVVIVTTVFFGFYLFALDLVMTKVFELLVRH